MKLDVNVLRYLSKDDFRVLTSVEMGQKNHEIVPMPLIDSISGLKHGGAYKCIRNLLKHKLVHHENQKYDGYRLTYMGYDFLAIRAFTARGHISGVGRQIGVGKESDIYEVTNDEGEVFALKLHRLGRTSFRAVKNQRDYLGRRTNYSWLYLSRLAALKEFAFMKALWDNGFPVPQAIDSNRHAVLMQLMDAKPMVQIKQHIAKPAQVYLTCMELIGRLAGKGLIHCDFNEFNLLLDDDDEVTIIDFPQMVSVSHKNAKELFERDVECIIRFFTKKVGYNPLNDPALPYIRPAFEEAVSQVDDALDVALAASGFQKQHQQALEEYINEQEEDEVDDDEDDDEDEEESEVDGDDDDVQEGVAKGFSKVQLGDDEDGEEDGQIAAPRRKHRSQQQDSGDAVTSHAHDDGDGEGEDEGVDSEGSGDEGAESDGGSEDEDGNIRQQKDKPAIRKVKVHPSLGEREVQAAVVAQQKRVMKAEKIARVTRNSTKQQKGKGGKKGKSGGGGGGGDFGGW